MRPSSSLTNTLIMPRQIIIGLLGAITGLIIHFYLLSSEGFLFEEFNIMGLLGAIVIGVGLGYISLLTSVKLNDLLPWENSEGRRLLFGILFHFVIAILVYYLFYEVTWSFLIETELEYPVMSTLTTIKLSVITLVLVFIFSILYYAHYSYQTFAFAQVNQTQLKREIIDLQMDTLKSQLRPHFLFNSLNTISSLMHKDTGKTERFIRRLADTYQYTLENYNKQEVTLREELSLVESYFRMMRARFGNSITVKNDIPKSLLSKSILPLSIQSLVENALKHNVISEEAPLTITLTGNNDTVTISNNITKAPSSVTSNNIGLTNLAKRYRLWNNKTIEVKNELGLFTVSIPVI